LEHELTV